jgi:hypothetical protein
MISAITPSNHDKNTLYLRTRDITKEDQEQSKSPFVTRSNYKGLNESVTFMIYHMA